MRRCVGLFFCGQRVSGAVTESRRLTQYPLPIFAGLLQSGFRVALEFESGVVKHQLFRGLRDHLQYSSGFGEFLIREQATDFLCRGQRVFQRQKN